MFCVNCGTARAQGSNFCGQCGKAFVASPQVADTAASPSPGVQTFSAPPAQPAYAPQPIPKAAIGDGFYWAFATSPIALMILNWLLVAVLGADGGQSVGGFLGLFYVLLALSIDASRIRKAGLRVPVWMGVLLPPLYIFKRAKATGRNQSAFVVWLVGCVISLILAFAGASNLGNSFQSESYRSGQQAGQQAAKDRFNNLFGSIENSCAAKTDYYTWTNYNEFIQGCVDEYNAESGN